jgi:hypothetical protein
MQKLIGLGEAGQVVRMVLYEPEIMALPDEEKRSLITQSLEHRRKTGQNAADARATEAKIKQIGRSRKEGHALQEQLEHMFPEARRKFLNADVH